MRVALAGRHVEVRACVIVGGEREQPAVAGVLDPHPAVCQQVGVEG
jgi:hypothetical protein